MLFNQLKDQENKQTKANLKIEDLKTEKTKLETQILSYKKFLKLIGKIPDRFAKAKTISKLNWLMQKLFITLFNAINFLLK